ncbi:uncharacterized protein PWA37_001080 [Arxiozyma heterogenica]|uniref:non-specific serine/threonine protein kinase n=1 Tax=Arxiozyma heterogenica TaxID=278026 RepID=A0AAN7WLK6_9SACH|nr:hypothetical protein RI543_004606 [Kazachstania heterogenica]
MSTFQNCRHTHYGGTILTSPSSVSHNRKHNQNQISSHPQKFPTFGPYIVGSTLGQGEFGKVKLGWSKVNSSNGDYTKISKQVAIKLIKRDTLINDKSKEIKIYREINALKQSSHPNIVRLEEVLQNSKYIGIVLEYASGGEIYKYIQKRRCLKENVACKLFSQLISGVKYIHSKGLVHRDLKLENLLLDKNENLIITDFGFVNEYYSNNGMMETSCGSPCYAAPELVISNKPYDARKADIWSCGIILFAMLAGYLPWDDDSENPDGEDIARLYYYIVNTPLKFPDYIAPIPRDLLRRILVVKPSKRIAIEQICHHSWLSPYLSMLSITAQEWDKIYESKDLLRIPKHHKQYSQRPHSICSTASNYSKGTSNGNNSNTEKRNSLIMDNTLYAFPAPPREYQSHVLAIPSAPSPELRAMNSRSPGKRGHNRSNSAASLALQAVVDADRQHFTSTSSFSSFSSYTTNNNNNNSTNIPNHSNNNSNSQYNSRNADSNFITPVCLSELNNEQINLSPLKLDDSKLKNSAFVSSYIRYNNGNKSRISYSQSRKPRPTSYYPGLISENNHVSLLSSSSYSSISITPLRGQHLQKSDSNANKSPFDSIPNLGTDTAVTSMTEITEDEDCGKKLDDIKKINGESPKLVARKTSSIFSKVSVDTDVNASGDIMKINGDIETLIKRVQEHIIIDENEKEKEKESEIENCKNTKSGRPCSMYTTTTTTSSSVHKTISPTIKEISNNILSKKNNGIDVNVEQLNDNMSKSKSNINKHRYKRSNVRHNIKRTSMIVTQPVIIEDETPTYESINVTSAPHNYQTISRTRKVIDFFKRRSMKI